MCVTVNVSVHFNPLDISHNVPAMLNWHCRDYTNCIIIVALVKKGHHIEDINFKSPAQII